MASFLFYAKKVIANIVYCVYTVNVANKQIMKKMTGRKEL